MLTNADVKPMLQGQQTTIIPIIDSSENANILWCCIIPNYPKVLMVTPVAMARMMTQ